MRNVWSKDNLILAFNRLITNPESTYKNYFRHSYNAYSMALKGNIEALRQKKSGFLPTKTARVFLPKANGLSRQYLLMSIEDQIVYQAYGNIIAEYISRNKKVTSRYKKTVFGNLYSGFDSPFFYQTWQNSYSAYTKAVKKAYSDGYNYIASFDLTACYDSINHELLKTILTKKFRIDEPIINQFIALLKTWTTSDLKFELSTGIPQGPLTSGIISESVLSEYDDEIEKIRNADFKYYRYVDDIRVLAKDEETVRWVLFLLDKKSKEIGLFPQSSKITAHKIENIEQEIESISRPLFEDDIEESAKGEIAAVAINRLIKENSNDLTSIKRYFSFVDQNHKTNKVAIKAIKQYPNLIHSFAYYVKRYPRKIPPLIIDYIIQSCHDKTQQFASGLLLEASIGNVRMVDRPRLLELAKKIIEEDKKKPFIFDCRFKVQLLMYILLYSEKYNMSYVNYLKKSNWWVKSSFIYMAQEYELLDKLPISTIKNNIMNDLPDVALSVAYSILLSGNTNYLPNRIADVAPVAQETLKQVGLIQRKRVINTQINKYLKTLTSAEIGGFQWKKKLGKEHDEVERKIFTAIGYWNTDLTAFVNIWDTINDKILSIVVKEHGDELGGYSLGNIGGIVTNKRMKATIPKFHTMCTEIHALRLASELSHFEIRKANVYTGPISQKKRRNIKKMIREGYEELLAYW